MKPFTPSLFFCFGLLFTVTGRTADSAQLSERKAPGVRIFLSPLAPKDLGQGQSLLVVQVDTAGITNAILSIPDAPWQKDWQKPLPPLAKGNHRITWPIPALTSSVKINPVLQWENSNFSLPAQSLSPAKPWTVYLVQHTHTDIGYTRPQTEILPEHLRYIDYALDYCDITEGYPDDAKFRWTCETSWAPREYLKRRPANQLARLRQRVQEGRIEIAGMLLNMSEIATESSLAASLQPLRDLKREFGASVTTALQNDVNGAAWCLVDYFQQAGIKYLAMGINKTRSILPFEIPTAFWWESPSGKRILAWRADHYMTANFWQINQGKTEAIVKELENYLHNLEAKKYPFDRVSVQFSGYFTDNSPPSTVACDVVKAWNEQYAWPKLRLATAKEFLGYVEQNHGNNVPVFRVAWPDWWTDGFGSAARETAATRITSSALQTSQGLLSMAAIFGAGKPAFSFTPGLNQRILDIQDDLLFYAEHTFGAAESISEPLAENTQVQWGEKGAYAWTAVKNFNMLKEEAFGYIQDFLPKANVPVISVMNTLNWTRSTQVEVFIDHEILPKDREFQIVDASTKKSLPVQLLNQRAEGAFWAIWVNEVPPLGYKTLRIEVNPTNSLPKTTPYTNLALLENSFYSLKMDAASGAVKSFYDKALQQELIDSSAPRTLGQLIYETMPNDREMVPSKFSRTSVRNVKIQPGVLGPIWSSLTITADLDGCATNHGIKAEVRLFNTDKRIELHFAMRKLPINTPESVYVAFPFASSKAQMVYEAQGGPVIPGKDQLPGSSSDWQTIQSYLAVRYEKFQVIMGSEQAPLVQLGDINLGKWQPVTQIDKNHVYSWIMNNYWFTNFRANQEGEFKWHYYLTSTPNTSLVHATHFGWDSRIPLASRVFPPAKAASLTPPSASLLAVNASNVLLVESRPALSGKGLVFILRELEGKTTQLSAENVTFAAPVRQVDEINILEETTRENVGPVTLAPFEIKMVKVLFD